MARKRNTVAKKIDKAVNEAVDETTRELARAEQSGDTTSVSPANIKPTYGPVDEEAAGVPGGHNLPPTAPSAPEGQSAVWAHSTGAPGAAGGLVANRGTMTDRVEQIEQMVAGRLGLSLEAHDEPAVADARDQYLAQLASEGHAPKPDQLTLEQRIDRIERALHSGGRIA